MKEQIISITISLVILVYYIFASFNTQPVIVFLDVKQGDSMLFQSKTTQVLVDGGSGLYALQKLGNYMPIYDRNIEWVVLTHAHLDHFGGLIHILDDFSIENIVLPVDLCKENMFYSIFREKLKEKNVKVYENIDLKFDEIEIKTNNLVGDCVTSSKEINNSTIVTQITRGNLKILNMGDVQSDREESLSYKGFDILKAGHHCSDTSSSEGFVEKITPRFVICSFGKDNTFGHPAQTVLDRFEALGSKIFTTAVDGDIVVNLITGLIYNGRSKIIGKL